MVCLQRRAYFHFRFQGFLILLIVLSACSQRTISPAITATKDRYITTVVSDKYETDRLSVVKNARKHLGKNYRYAGTGPDDWDCSGLTIAAYQGVDIDLPRTARGMAKLGDDIGVKNAKTGDLVFFIKDGRVFHVSVIAENTGENLWVVHSTTSRGVIEEDILASTYWNKKVYKVISLASLKSR